MKWIVFVFMSLFMISLVSAILPVYISEDGLLSYYNLDEITGQIAIDQTGNNNGTNHNVSLGRNGVINTSYAFNGSIPIAEGYSSYINISNSSTLFDFDSFTLSSWVNISTFLDPSGEQYIIDRRDFDLGDDDRPFSLWVFTPWKSARISIRTEDEKNYDAEYSGITENKWHFMTATYNTTTANLTFYVDGIARDSEEITGNTLLENSDTPTISIGRQGRQSGDYNQFNGTLDEIGIWDRSLNKDEVFRMYIDYYISSFENEINYEINTSIKATNDFSINYTFNSSLPINSKSANFWYNNSKYNAVVTEVGEDTILSRSIVVPLNSGNYSFNWEIGITNVDGTTWHNTSISSQQVFDFEIDDCSINTNLIYNFTVRDEEDRSILAGGNDNVTTEVELHLSPLGETIDPFLTFSQTYNSTNPATICSSDYLNSTYRTDIVASYISLDHVQEFYFVDNGTISNNTSPQEIDLHDLLLADSTTFLFNFLDENGLDPDDALIQTERKYIGDGVFREVERSKEDDNGETHVHLVEEDVIYRFRVTQYGNELYLSSEFNAKCLSTPCEITLSAEEDVTEYEDDYDNLPEGTMSIDVNKVTRQVTMTFNLNASRTMNLTVYEYNNLIDDEAVASGQLTASSGSVIVTVPQIFGNATFYAEVLKDGNFVDSFYIDLTPEAKDWFPNGLGLILTALMVLVLALMGAGQGVMIVIMTLIALIVASLIFLLDLDMVALMGIISAGAILVWKLVKGRNTG